MILLFNLILTKGSTHSSFVDAQVYNRTENDSISGYVRIQQITQSIDEYDMRSDFDSEFG